MLPDVVLKVLLNVDPKSFHLTGMLYLFFIVFGKIGNLHLRDDRKMVSVT